jgi:hypothetical protein
MLVHPEGHGLGFMPSLQGLDKCLPFSEPFSFSSNLDSNSKTLCIRLCEQWHSVLLHTLPTQLPMQCDFSVHSC